MRAQRALAVFQSLHDRGDRYDRRVAGKDRVGRRVTFDVSEQPLLERQILQDRFDDVIGFAHGFGEFEAWPHPRDRQRSSPRSRKLAAMRLVTESSSSSPCR